MKRPAQLRKRPLAERDLVEIHAYLLERSEKAARAYLTETRKAFDLILSVPGIG